MACVVVAEDNVDHQRVIAEVVRRLGHEVVVAGDGRAGLAAVAQHRPALVIADVDMPLLDGLQLCRAIHDDPGLTGTPVVLITAFLPPGDAQLAAAGAEAVISKPFGVRDLVAALSPYLGEEPPPVPEQALRPAGPGQPSGALGAGAPQFVDALLDSLDTGVAACDTAGRLVAFNRALTGFFGTDGAAVPLRDWPRRFALRHHDGTPLLPHELPLLRALTGENVRHADVVAVDRHDRPRWYAINAQPVHDPAGTLLGAVAAVHDVTPEVRARQYQVCKTEVLKVLAGSPDTATAAGQMLHAVGSSLGWPYLRLWLVDEVTDVLRPVADYTAPGEPAPPLPGTFARGEGMAGLCWERGEPVWVADIHAADSPVVPAVADVAIYRAAGAVPVRSGSRVTGVLTFFTYVAQEPEPALGVLLAGIAGNIGAYLDRRRAEELTLHLAATTDEYIALVGHELRTPLTSIGSYIDLIAESADDTTIGDVRDMLEVIQRNNDRLRAIVERLLDLAALQSGHAGMARAEVDLAAIVSAAADAVRDAAGERRMTVAVEISGPITVRGDAERLRQVVDNLLDNALKFSPDGATVETVLRADGNVAVLAVTDPGIGIPPEARPYLFRQLFRADNARHTGLPGAGLGLALSRLVVERHHGTITLDSHHESGTTVVVRLPRTSA